MTKEMFFKIIIIALLIGSAVSYYCSKLKKENKKLKDEVSKLKSSNPVNKITNGSDVTVKT